MDPHSGNVPIKPAAAEEKTAGEGAEAAPDADKLPLSAHAIEWIDFGMMGTLNAQQRQILIDIVTHVVMQDAYALKRTVLQAAKPQGEINRGALPELCEGMCSRYTRADFGDFELGDLMGAILGSLQSENYRIDPFLITTSPAASSRWRAPSRPSVRR